MSMRGLPDALLGPDWTRELAAGAGAAAHDGMLLFVQYAFMPNRLAYCGTDNDNVLLDYWTEGFTDRGLAKELQTFTGALPYLKLIAHGNDIADPFDRRVVEAYWIGNALLEQVEMRQFFELLVARFGPQLQRKALDYVTQKIPLGARPHHSFHVLDVHSQVGQLAHGLAVMEHCRVSWGEVTAVEPAHLTVSSEPLELRDGALALGPPAPRRVLRAFDGRGFASDVAVGDTVSIHWRCACQVLSAEQVERLARYTRHHIRLANLTV